MLTEIFHHQRLVAAQSDIQEDLGAKGKSGHLATYSRIQND
jgi:hypothetical protein